MRAIAQANKHNDTSARAYSPVRTDSDKVSPMKIIIPMTGLGKRFATLGYLPPKPLITVCGKPFIELMIASFPGKHDFTFICNAEHLAHTALRSELERIAPGCEIISHEYFGNGPVYDIAQIYDKINDGEEVMVSYCDYFMDWDFEKFQRDIVEKNCDAAVPSYTGFHPHLLHKNVYAGVLLDESGLMTAIKEKHSFTDNPMDSHHSAGAYYFRRGVDLKKYFSEQMEKGMGINGEFYASTPYELLLRDGLRILVPPIEKFAQLGTAEDFEEFMQWANHFADLWKLSRPESDVPLERRSLIEPSAIPYPPESREFRLCYAYWEPVFKRLLN